MIIDNVESLPCKEERSRSNLTLRSLLERVGRAKAAAHCPVYPASLRFNLTAFEVDKFYILDLADYLGDK